jgi:hypothetical protein
MTEDDEKRDSLLKNLRHAWKAWDAIVGNDPNLRTDVMRRIRKCESELICLGVGQSEIAAFNVAEDEHERANRKMRAIAAYAKTRLISE